MVDGLAATQPIDAADHVVELAEAELGHDLPHFLGHEGEEPHHVLRLAGEPLPQFRLLRGDADRAGAQVALPHQQAAQRDQGRGAEAEAFGAEQGADDHVAAGLHLAVDLDDDPVAQAVEDQRLLGFGQAEFPGRAGVLDRAKGLAPVPPSWPLMSTSSALPLATPAATVPTPTSETSFTETITPGIGALQVVDQLGQVFDGIDVVVRRRRNQRHAGRGVPQPGDLLGHLVGRQLPALARLGPLGHLDLQDLGVGQVLDGHAEPGAGHLLDAAVERVAVGQRLVAARVFAAFARVRVAPSRFMAMASVSWASLLIEPCDMAPV